MHGDGGDEAGLVRSNLNKSVWGKVAGDGRVKTGIINTMQKTVDLITNPRTRSNLSDNGRELRRCERLNLEWVGKRRVGSE